MSKAGEETGAGHDGEPIADKVKAKVDEQLAAEEREQANR
jgi:hypothetical protein